MLEFMEKPHEDPRENHADAEGRPESGPDPDGTGSQETGSDPQTIAEQSAPALATLLSIRPPQRPKLKHFLSQIIKDSAEVDALIRELEAQSAERVQLSIQVLESLLLTRLDAQGDKVEKQHEEIRKQGASIDGQGDMLGSLVAEVRARGVKLEAYGVKLEAYGVKLDAYGVKLDARGEKIDSLSTKIDVLDAKENERFKVLRRQKRFMIALLAVLIALCIFGWLGQSRSRPLESNAQGEASQEAVGQSGDVPPSTAANREPSAEPRETGDSIGDDESTEADGERPVADPDDRR